MRSRSHACSVLASLTLLWLGIAAAQKAPAWKTLNGNAPAVIAKGGFSGLFPGSSQIAYDSVKATSSPDTILYCDVRLSSDGRGFCLPDATMDDCTDVKQLYPQDKKSYQVNGVPTAGWFSVDYNSTDLARVSLKQSVFSRTPRFDFIFPILAVEDVQSKFKPPSIWLNIQHDSFYNQFNLSMRNYILSVSKRVVVNYISSPEVRFLTSILGRVSNKTKLMFRFLDETTPEPSTKQTYGSMLKNLTFVKTFASGILVPKQYIWPVSRDNYLQPHTSVVDDAHKAGLEIYAADFGNDFVFSYNYSYDPIAEYVSFVDDDAFSVDGVLTDFPVTASAAIGCFTNLNKSNTNHGFSLFRLTLNTWSAGKPLIISHNGASGDYPDCTDLAYQKAVDDGADIIVCPVQVTKDGIPICMSSINLMYDTTVATSQFASLTSVIKDIQSEPDQNICTILFLRLDRNPRYRNTGKFMKLTDFLDFANDKDLYGIMISVEHAAFFAAELGFDMVSAVLKALDDASYNNHTTQKVLIQSTNSSALVKFKEQAKYDLVYMVAEEVRDASPSSLADLKKFASAVSVDSSSIFAATHNFTTYRTNIVQTLQTAGLSVYVYPLMNEFASQAYDFFSDATAQIIAYVQANNCMNMGKNTPIFMDPAPPGGLITFIPEAARPPAMAPMPLLTGSDVAEPPLPAARSSNGTTPTQSRASRTHAYTTHIPILVTLAMLSAFCLLL
ncbi:hypothetical protein EJB05_39161 [Eragrostis curvula]|uniref:glycerophosphodiester phosphodiesterase n=1 Tax=Eragrostis curvula TaxID=38414 RepID=A0A5J9TY55_9POAL|nr:hypothetical protein EJB05_39161 [Eragrostis curvula]